MKNWKRRIKAALGLGLIWGLGWGLIGGFIMEAFVDPHGRIADMWPQGLGITGFFGGLLFAIVLGLSEGRRRFDELSLARVGVGGAVAGALLVLAGMLIGLNPGFAALVLGPVTLMSAASAAGSLAVARLANDHGRLRSGERSTDHLLE